MRRIPEHRPPGSRRAEVATGVALACLLWAMPSLAADETARALSPADAVQVRRLAVVSLLGESIHGSSSGLSVFQRRYLNAHAGWRIDAELALWVAERAIASGRLRGAYVEPLAVADPSVMLRNDRRRPIDEVALALLARERGYDAVLAILPVEHPAHPDAPAGASIVRQQRPGGEISRACAALTLRVLRTSDARTMAWAAPAPCAPHAQPIPWHGSWEAYTPEEADGTLDTLRRHVRLVVGEALAALELRPPVRPGNRAP